MNKISSSYMAKGATDHELANNWRDAKENNDESRIKTILHEALSRGICVEELESIR